MDIFFFEAFAEEADALRRYLGPDLRAGFSAATIQEYAAPTPPAPLISIRTQSLLPTSWAPALAGVLTRSTGYDHLSAYRRAIGQPQFPCGYLPLYCARAVAEQALLLWLALLRKLPQQLQQLDRFHRDGLSGRECAGKTLAVFGVGHIGREIVRIGRGLGLQVVGVDPVRREPDLTYVEPAAALARADILVCAMNLTPQNRGYFDARCWQQTQPHALFINIARGELAPPEALLAALEAGRLAGVALDVYDEEQQLAVRLRQGETGLAASASVQATLALRRRPDVICTPHNAFNTLEAVERKSEQSLQQVRHFRQHRQFLWPVPE